jgi:SAM-dependent methyltransferase
VFPARFDAVFCTGNSIVHSGGEAGMVAALAGMREVLRPGGVLVVESRDWEQLYAERPRLQIRDHVAVRGGVRGLALYVWTIPESWGEPCTAEIILLLDDGQKLAHRSVELHFAPYRRSEFTERLERTGFGALDVVDHRPGWYFVSAIRSS